MKTESHAEPDKNDFVPDVKVTDPNAYVSSTKVIAHIIIQSPNGEQKRPLVRTKNGGYMMQ